MEANEITAAVQAALKAEKEAEAKAKAEADAIQAKIDEGIKAGLQDKQPVNRATNLNLKAPKGDDPKIAMWHWMKTGDNGGLRANPEYRHTDPNDPNFNTPELQALKTDYEIMGASNQGAELIPTEILNTIYEQRTALSIARAAGAEVRQVSTRTIWVPIEVTPTVWPVVTNESTALTQPQATVLDKKIVPIQTYGKAIYMANPTLQDSVADVVGWYASWVARGLALTENAEMLVGDGTANCLGVHVVTTGHTAGVTAASATAITAAEVTALYFTVPSEYRDNVAWTMTGAVEGAIRGLQSDGFNFQLSPAGGAGFPQGAGWLVAPNARVFNSASCPAATANLIPIVVGNWAAGYIICQSQAMTIFRDPYSRALYNEVAFHCTARFGGIVRDPLAFRGLTMASA